MSLFFQCSIFFFHIFYLWVQIICYHMLVNVINTATYFVKINFYLLMHILVPHCKLFAKNVLFVSLSNTSCYFLASLTIAAWKSWHINVVTYVVEALSLCINISLLFLKIFSCVSCQLRCRWCFYVFPFAFLWQDKVGKFYKTGQR